MATHTNGPTEAVPSRCAIFGPDCTRLLVLAIVSLAVHAWILTHTTMTARDALEFARYACNLKDPSAGADPPGSRRSSLDVVREGVHPPGFPVAVLTASEIVLASTNLSVSDGMLRAQLANAFAGLLLIVPTYLLGRMLFGRCVGFAFALLIQVLPVFAQVTSDGLSEGVYLLISTSALLLGVRALRRPTNAGFLQCGLAVGLSYLVRPEGLLVGVAMGMVAFLLAAARKWPAGAAVARLFALAAGMLLTAGPYMVLIGGVTNKTTGQQLLNQSNAPSGEIWKGQPTSRAGTSSPLFAVWWNETMDAGKNHFAWAVQGVVLEIGKTAYYFPAILGVIGLFVFRRRVFADPGLLALMVLIGLNFALLVYLAATKGYVSERHTVLIALVLCLFASAMLEPTAAALSRLPLIGRLCAGPYATVSIMFVIIFSAMPATLKPLHKHREGHKHAGEFLAHAVGPEDAVIDPFSWAQWYAGRTLYRIPPDPKPEDVKVRWAVIEKGDSPHSRLPRLEAALAVTKDGENPPTVAYHWPEGVPSEQAKVLVYRQVVKR